MTTPIPSPTTPSFAVIGGGISGLAAAYAALERGESNIHVYEATSRFGGKIESGAIGDQVVNRGAEFIDSDHSRMIALCQKFGVPLVENKGMEREEFQRPDGKMMDSDAFYTAYKPYAEQVMRDRAEMAATPNSPRAQHVRSLSLTDYLAELRQTVPPAERSWWQAIKDTLMLHGNESPLTLDIAAQAYASEVGQLPANISASQFLAETSATADCFLASDAKWRVEGGTQRLLDAMREQLAAKGVQFHTNSELKRVSKQGNGALDLGFASGERVQAGKMLFAGTAATLGNIEGLDQLGLNPQTLSEMGTFQYTKNIKCTVAFKPGMATPDAAFFSNHGYQTWSPAPGMLTFLANAPALGTTQTPKELLGGLMESYASAHGSNAAAMFDVSKLNFTNPGSKPCYATPKAEQLEAMAQFKAQLPALAQNGIGIAGTYLPHNGGYGFMECGATSAQQSVDLLVGQEQSTGLAQQKQWAPHIAAQRAANDAQYAVAANAR